jgi:hypothetical protein
MKNGNTSAFDAVDGSTHEVRECHGWGGLRSAHRKRRRNGVRLLNVTVSETVIKDAIARGLLAA